MQSSTLFLLRFAHLQSDADFAAFVICKMNADLFQGVLYFEDRGEISSKQPFILLDALKRRHADTGRAGKLSLAPP